MSRPTVPERYVRLCLEVGAHLEDFVDAFIGPAALKQEVSDAGPVDPAILRDEALALLDETPAADLEDDRVRWLTGQLRAVECVAARLAGEDVSWSDEVERCFGIRPQHVDEKVFRASHARLDEVLPGNGALSPRYNAWRDASNIPHDALGPAIDVMGAELRRRAGELVDLPSGERVEWETVSGVPWQAFNWYRGDLSSLVQISLDLPMALLDLLETVAHEAYPGHHTERACKEKLLYGNGSRIEMSVMVLAAPEAMIAEGIATNALEVALTEGGVAAMLETLEGLVPRIDAAAAEVVQVEEALLFSAGTNVARMLHEDGVGRDEAEAYLIEWALYSPERAAKIVSFLLDPGSRTYATTYTDGKRLCRSFIDRSRDGFRRLLTEQLTVSSLLEA